MVCFSSLFMALIIDKDLSNSDVTFNSQSSKVKLFDSISEFSLLNITFFLSLGVFWGNFDLFYSTNDINEKFLIKLPNHWSQISCFDSSFWRSRLFMHVGQLMVKLLIFDSESKFYFLIIAIRHSLQKLWPHETMKGMFFVLFQLFKQIGHSIFD